MTFPVVASEGGLDGPEGGEAREADRRLRAWSVLAILALGCVRGPPEDWSIPEMPPWEGRTTSMPRDPSEWRSEAGPPGRDRWSLEIAHRIRMRGWRLPPKERTVRERLRLESEGRWPSDPSGSRWTVIESDIEVEPPQEETADLLARDLLGVSLTLGASPRPATPSDGPAREVAQALRMSVPLLDLDAHVEDEHPWSFLLDETREMRGHGGWTLRRTGSMAWKGSIPYEERSVWHLEGAWEIEGRPAEVGDMASLRGRGRGRWRIDPRTGRTEGGEVNEAARARVSREGHPRWFEMTWTTEIRFQRQGAQ